jgi:alkanesulfonate monooxygenase SsuD/methylene tetrahydromethanopterin reductase-like flavin-dependent oxidoreductase (luciferase family)
MDYGHDLIFGSFITPAASALPQLEHAAREAERVGLDLVTVQDHPYNPGFLDTVTLIGHLAARTEHVRFAGNVLNLPLRPPAMLAKQIATLDRLSGGRVELGLGAGAFWDAIEAYGAPRLTRGQAVDAPRSVRRSPSNGEYGPRNRCKAAPGGCTAASQPLRTEKE